MKVWLRTVRKLRGFKLELLKTDLRTNQGLVKGEIALEQRRALKYN